MAELLSYLKECGKRLSRQPIVSIYGYGITGKAVYEKIKDNYTVTVRDNAKSLNEAPTCRLFLGENADHEIFEDIVFLSPSIRRDTPALLKAQARGILLTSDAEVFFENNKTPAFTVTGSDGKSTTATLTSMLLSYLHKTELCGNIGTPFCSVKQDNADAVVAELSSFNLMYLTPHSVRAGITNIVPNHLNWHKSYEEYRDTKLKVMQNARDAVFPFDTDIIDTYPGDIFALYSVEDSYEKMRNKRHAVLYFSLNDDVILLNGKPIISVSNLARREWYNMKNFMCALALTFGYTNDDAIREVAREFTGIRHRAEVIATIDGKRYIDSSIDSTPSRLAATLSELNGKINLILGGRGKGLSINPILPLLLQRVEYIAVYGDVSDEYYEILLRGGFNSSRLLKCDKFNTAFDFVYDNRAVADIILLSPACTSYGEFSDYRERGERFSQLVENITKQRN